MIVIEIGPGGVQRVSLQGSAVEQSRSLERWPLIQRALARLNRQLQDEALRDVMRESPPEPDRAPE